jgi:NtrC-family two-component system response regulator AlgB
MPRNRVLLVDDEPALLLTYGKILERHGYLVRTADSVVHAFGELQERVFEILISDLTLKGSRRGFEIIDLAFLLYPSIRAILLTGLGDPEVEAEAASKGVEVLFKPVEIPKLLETISRLLQDRDTR